MKKLALAAVVLTSAALSGSAFARTFTFPGAVCRPIFDSLSSVEYDQYGLHAVSSSATAITVECPLLLDYPASGPVPAVTLVDTTVYDRNGTLSCTLQQVSDDGNLFVSITKSATGGTGSSPATDLTFTPVGAAASGYWRLRCIVPPKGGGVSNLVTTVVHTSE
jgi:hypothetical protein